MIAGVLIGCSINLVGLTERILMGEIAAGFYFEQFIHPGFSANFVVPG